MLDHEHFVTGAIHNFNAVLLQTEEDIGLAHVLHFVVSISQGLHGGPVLQLVLIGLLRGYKRFCGADSGLVKVVESEISVASDGHLVGARGIHNHPLLCFVPLVAQDYPLKKRVIDELQDYMRVQVRLILALGVLDPNLISQLQELTLVRAHRAHEFHEKFTEYFSTSLEVLLLALRFFEIKELCKLVYQFDDLLDDTLKVVFCVLNFDHLNGGLQLGAYLAKRPRQLNNFHLPLKIRNILLQPLLLLRNVTQQLVQREEVHMFAELPYLLQLFEILVEGFRSFCLLEKLLAAASNNRETMVE